MNCEYRSGYCRGCGAIRRVFPSVGLGAVLMLGWLVYILYTGWRDLTSDE